MSDSINIQAGGDVYFGKDDATQTINHFVKINGVRIPLQRPPKHEHFKDREEELKNLLRDLKPGKIITLQGPGGIGKTAISAKAVWTLAPENKPPEMFPDGIIFHSFYGYPDVNQAFDHIVRSYIEHPEKTLFETIKSPDAELVKKWLDEPG